MNKVILDDSLLAQLNSGDEPLQLCAPSGETVGHFLPEEVYQRLLYDWANAKVTDEELQRRLQQPGGRTLAEIWSRLECEQNMESGLGRPLREVDADMRAKFNIPPIGQRHDGL